MGIEAQAAPITLLVLEDDPDISFLVEELLVAEGFDVHVARTAGEAFRWLETHVPSLILLDLLVPDMPGWEFDARRRADPRLAGVPLIVSSGLPAAAMEERPIDAVARLAKPYRIEELFTLIRRHARPGPIFDPSAETVEVVLDEVG